MRRCAFLTLDHAADYVVDDDLAREPMRALGWDVESVPWTRVDARINDFDVVVIRSTYDYIEAPDEFLDVLSRIVASGMQLFNSLELVRWNLRKTYLADLAARGVPTVPTLWRSGLTTTELPGLFDEIDEAELVIKPVVGANASGAFRVDRNSSAHHTRDIDAFYDGRAAMVQPFVPAIVAEGEYSLFYFNGVFSHAILKTPKDADFRVQEEHGGRILPVAPEPSLRAAGAAALRALDETPLYARTDLVRSRADDEFWLMELELIEPSLYLRTDPHAPARLARAIHERAGPVRD